MAQTEVFAVLNEALELCSGWASGWQQSSRIKHFSQCSEGGQHVECALYNVQKTWMTEGQRSWLLRPEKREYLHAWLHTHTRFSPIVPHSPSIVFVPLSTSRPVLCLVHALSLARTHTHTLSHSLLPAWMSTVARSLPLCLYEWWPSPALDRKEDRSHLNSATPPLLNQTSQCQYTSTHTHHTHTHTLHPTQLYTDSGRPQQHNVASNFIQKLIVQAKASLPPLEFIAPN